MSAGQGLPYEECRRQQERAAPRDGKTPWPAYALPPFHPGVHGVRDREAPSPPPRPGRRKAGSTAVSDALTALCVVALLVAILLPGWQPAG
ncbi:hypothetical protein AB0N17_29215 [Streptomyces sp. NPDC051133]|uniref:hypothetical protein n=1 Tax=Streptomyces sp. NPDC051133 TaxID=3155521 RepID=UPI00343AE216